MMICRSSPLSVNREGLKTTEWCFPLEILRIGSMLCKVVKLQFEKVMKKVLGGILRVSEKGTVLENWISLFRGIAMRMPWQRGMWFFWNFPGGGRRLKDVIDAHPSVTARLYRAFLIGISARIRGANSLVKENSPLVQELRRQVYEDKLTGLNNRTRFQEVLSQQLQQCTAESPVGLLMFKPDNFKTFNDSFGHEIGDRLLKHMARVLKGLELDKERVFRYTGNENAVIFSNTSEEELLQWSQTIGDTMRSLDFSGIISVHLSSTFHEFWNGDGSLSWNKTRGIGGICP